MTTRFPEDIDAFDNPRPDSSQSMARTHSQQHGDANDAIEALQLKVGADESGDIASLDFKVGALENVAEGLGSAAFQESGSFASAAQGGKADTAVQPDQLSSTQAMLQDQVDSLVSGQQTSAIYKATFAELQAIPGAYVGQGGFVPSVGQYSWSGSQWVKIADDTLAQKASKSEVAQVTAHNGEMNVSLSEFVEVPFTAVGPNKARSRVNGLEITQTGYQYAGFDVTGYEIAIRASGYVNHSGVAFAVYFDGNGAFLGMQFPGGAGNEPFEHINQALTLPAGTRKVYISTNTAFPTQLKFEVRKVIDSAAQRIVAAEESAAQVNGIAASLSGWVDQPIITVTGAYISKSTGLPITNASFTYARMELAPGDKLRASTRVQGTAVALAVYYTGADGTGYIGYEVDGTGTPTDYVDYELTIPANARSVAIVGRVGYPISLDKVAVVPNVADRLQALENESSSAHGAISLFGDSMIADAATGIAPELVAALPGRMIYKQGIGGQDARQVAARMGAIPLSITIQGGLIPLSGSAPCVPSIDLLRRSGGVATCKVMVQGVLCALTFDFSLNSGAGGYTVAAIDAPASAVPVAADTPARVLSGWVSGASSAGAIPLGDLLSGTVIVRVDRNDADPSNSVEDVLSSNEAMVRQMQRFTAAWLWLGTTNGYADKLVADGGERTSPESSYAYLSRVSAFNRADKEVFSANYLDVMGNHVAAGGGQAYTVLGKTFDVLTSVVLVDGVHENSVGKNLTVQMIVDELSRRSW